MITPFNLTTPSKIRWFKFLLILKLTKYLKFLTLAQNGPKKDAQKSHFVNDKFRKVSDGFEQLTWGLQGISSYVVSYLTKSTYQCFYLNIRGQYVDGYGVHSNVTKFTYVDHERTRNNVGRKLPLAWEHGVKGDTNFGFSKYIFIIISVLGEQ